MLVTVTSHADALVAGVIILVAVGVAVAALAYLHVAPTGLSPVRDAVSHYGITPFRAGYRVQTMAFGVAGFAAAVGVARVVTGAGRAWVIVLLVVFAVARLVISWFPMDAPGTSRTRHGATHGILALVTFVAVTDAAVRLGRVLALSSHWATASAASTALGWYLLATLLLMMVRRRGGAGRGLFGVVERLFYLGVISWLVMVGILCVTA